MVLVSNLLLDFSDFFREKFHRSAALGAHHVVMTAAVVLMLIARDAVVKGDFAGQATTREKLQRAVHGGETDAGVGLFDQAVQFVGGKMFASFEERPQNGAALFGLFEANAFEMLQENSFGLADVLRRDGRVIVDSFLQHGVRRRNRAAKSTPKGRQHDTGGERVPPNGLVFVAAKHKIEPRLPGFAAIRGGGRSLANISALTLPLAADESAFRMILAA